MNPENLNDILIKSLSEYKEREFAHIPRECEIDYVFSDKYINKRNKITKNLSRSYWKFINTTAKKVAVIVLSLIIAFSSLMTVDAIREKVIEFIFKIYDTFTVIEPERKQSLDVIDKLYTIKESNEFVKTSEHSLDYMHSIYYFNEKGQGIMLAQHHSVANYVFDSENGELKEDIINDTPCLTCENDVNYFCYWEFDGYRFELIYPKELGKAYMAEVVGNLIEVEPENLSE